MQKDFESIMVSLLEQMDNNPNQDVDALIEKECSKLGISKEGKAMLSETNQLIDDFADSLSSLKAARDKGASRKGWFLKEMDKILEGRDEKEKAKVVSAISDTCENVNNEILKAE